MTDRSAGGGLPPHHALSDASLAPTRFRATASASARVNTVALDSQMRSIRTPSLRPEPSDTELGSDVRLVEEILLNQWRDLVPPEVREARGCHRVGHEEGVSNRMVPVDLFSKCGVQ